MTGSCCRSRPPTATRRSSTGPARSSSTGRSTGTPRSAWGSTAASARTWPGWNCASPCRPGWSASPNSPSPTRPPCPGRRGRSAGRARFPSASADRTRISGGTRMRIGLPGAASTPERMIGQAQRAEADGFSSLWYASMVGGDPLVTMALAGRATSTIELGTAVLQTYACHPALQAARAAAVVAAIGAPGRFTLGIGPSHEPLIEGPLGLSYATPGRETDEYVQITAALLRGEQVSFAGQEFRVSAGPLDLPGGAEVP